ncbi:MAG: hypothetical protein CVV44_18205 [Spirochaetae bacterium HGW-Spirochaetae-1]|jgi:hypothetical protein|nr:MAG: hypothetical protein CVV44_18205 [Spirochaetae bacterium HGW-Spirochaetae-1]
MMTRIIKNTLLLVALGAAVPGCWDRPLFTELATNRLEVRLKGTYASNDERAWQAPVNVNDGSIDDYPPTDVTTIADLPDSFKFDIAEMRLSGGGSKDMKFSIYRQTYTVGIDDTDVFFNDGIILDNDDPEPDRTYTHIKIYFRKMIFDKAMKYELSADGWSAGEPTEVIFREHTTEGFDFNQLQTNYLYDTWRLESDSTNRIFPVTIPIEGGLTFDNDTDKTVLEVRFVVKNFIKKYEYDRFDYTADNPFVAHFFGLSDWLRDVQPGDLQSGSAAIGGNILAVARAYVPGRTGSIYGTVDGIPANGDYIVAVPDGELISDYVVAADLRSTNVGNCDAPKAPSGAGSISALLDYYLKYEKYKADMNAFIISCVDQDTFETEWSAYSTAADAFKLPLLATVASGGNYAIENVSPGRYDLYYASPPAFGELFSNFTAGPQDVDVAAGSAIELNL